MRQQLILWGVVAACVAPSAAHANSLTTDAPSPELSVGEGERLLIIAPHPDDEALGAAGLAQRVLAKGGTVRTLVVTAGDGFVEAVQGETGRAEPRASDFVRYGERRIAEVKAAARALSPRGLRADVLGFPDGGLLPLLSAHWEHAQPQRSATTGHTRPPYRNSLDRGLTYSGADLRATLHHAMRRFKPTMVAFTDPLDEHADHHAVGVFALLAVSDWMQASQPGATWPRMLAFLVHWKQWPPDSGDTVVPTHLVDRVLQLPTNLPLRDQDRACLTLSNAELEQKQRSLAQYKTQQVVLGPFLASFVRRTECFSFNTHVHAQHTEAEVAQKLGMRRGSSRLALKAAAR
jgi:LmbE family N-acetylglucosaminyl deacetylase